MNAIALTLGIFRFEDVTHEYFTANIGKQPSKVHYKGLPVNPKFILLAKQNSWLLGADGYDIESFEYQLNSILALIKSKAEFFKEISQKYYLEIGCKVDIDTSGEESTPIININKEQMKVLAEFSIEIDYDIYLV